MQLECPAFPTTQQHEEGQNEAAGLEADTMISEQPNARHDTWVVWELAMNHEALDNNSESVLCHHTCD